MAQSNPRHEISVLRPQFVLQPGFLEICEQEPCAKGAEGCPPRVQKPPAENLSSGSPRRLPPVTRAPQRRIFAFFVCPSRLELNRTHRHNNGLGLTKMLTAKWLEIRMLQRYEHALRSI